MKMKLLFVNLQSAECKMNLLSSDSSIRHKAFLPYFFAPASVLLRYCFATASLFVYPWAAFSSPFLRYSALKQGGRAKKQRSGSEETPEMIRSRYECLILKLL